jgi:hypothetical protein
MVGVAILFSSCHTHEKGNPEAIRQSPPNRSALTLYVTLNNEFIVDAMLWMEACPDTREAPKLGVFPQSCVISITNRR